MRGLSMRCWSRFVGCEEGMYKSWRYFDCLVVPCTMTFAASDGLRGLQVPADMCLVIHADMIHQEALQIANARLTAT